MRADVLPDEGFRGSHEVADTSDDPAANNWPADDSPADNSPGDNSMDSLANLVANTSAGAGAGSLLASGSRRKAPSRAKCLLPEAVRGGAGVGPDVPLEDYSGKLLVVTLGITDVMERMGLSVSVWGSEDQTEWGSAPLVTFRQRQYCGVYSVLLNLSGYAGVRYLRVQWDMSHLGRGERGKGERTPLFGFQVFLEESGARVSSSAVA